LIFLEHLRAGQTRTYLKLHLLPLSPALATQEATRRDS
jgi:hypothetical protein